MKRIVKIYQEIASLVVAIKNCEKNNNMDWYGKHTDTLDGIMKTSPSGSGFDCGTNFDIEQSTENKLIFTFSFHHMDCNGMYCGWSEHILEVTPSFSGFNLSLESDYSVVDPKYASDDFDPDDFDPNDPEYDGIDENGWIENDPDFEDEYLYDVFYDWLDQEYDLEQKKTVRMLEAQKEWKKRNEVK